MHDKVAKCVCADETLAMKRPYFCANVVNRYTMYNENVNSGPVDTSVTSRFASSVYDSIDTGIVKFVSRQTSSAHIAKIA